MDATMMRALLHSKYLWSEEHELLLNIEWLNSKMRHERFGPMEKANAADDLRAVYEMLALFDSFKRMGLDTSGETGASMVMKMSGRSIGELKSSIGTTVALRLWGR